MMTYKAIESVSTVKLLGSSNVSRETRFLSIK